MRRATPLLAALACWSCAAQPPPRPAGPPVGTTHPPYCGMPWYFEQRQEPALGPVARWDERVPVAGLRVRPIPEEFDALRLLLADLDVEAVELRGQPVPRRTQPLARIAGEIVRSAEPWPNLVDYGEQLRRIAIRLAHAPAPEAARLIDRIFEVADLIRLQLRVGSPIS